MIEASRAHAGLFEALRETEARMAALGDKARKAGEEARRLAAELKKSRAEAGSLQEKEISRNTQWQEHLKRAKGLEASVQALKADLERTKRERDESEKKYRDLVDSLSDWVWEVDENGRYTYASKAVTKLLGYTPAEIIGKSPFDLMPSKEASRVKELFFEYFRNRQPFTELKNTNLHKNGHEVILETNGQPVIDRNGLLLGYRGIDRDITAREFNSYACWQGKAVCF